MLQQYRGIVVTEISERKTRMTPTSRNPRKSLLQLSICLIVSMGMAACGGGGGDSGESAADASPPPEPQPVPLSPSEQACAAQGWNRSLFKVGNIDRKVMWKAPSSGYWTSGVIVVMHGGGGKADDFCTGGPLVQPQVAFTNLAIQQGFAVFALESTDNLVTDAMGRVCGKRFDFAVNNRLNIDLPYIGHVLTSLIPTARPAGSNQKLFVTGLSTGGYMTIRAATHFDGLITAFAPVSAGDPYGTDPICDPNLSPRDSAIGILIDRETGLEIGEDNACLASSYPKESAWETQRPAIKPTFSQFQHQKDGIVDFSCAQKANATLQAAGYVDAGAFVLNAVGAESVLNHLWQNSYNQPLLNFFLNH